MDTNRPASLDESERLTTPPEPLPNAPTHPTSGVMVQPNPSASTGTVLDDAAKHEFLWHTHEYLNEYARFADTKAAFAGAIASALIGALYSAKAHMPIF